MYTKFSKLFFKIRHKILAQCHISGKCQMEKELSNFNFQELP